jgi:hypothetical protein
MAACFTAVTGVSADEAARRFGADLSSERAATFHEAFNDYPHSTHLLFDAIDDGVLIAENNGWEGSRPEVAEAVSRGGKLASVYWSVNADMSFVYAEDGMVLAWFDPLLVEQAWSGAAPESIAEPCEDLEFGVSRARSDALVLLQRLTGVRLDRSWLEEPHRCVDIPSPLAQAAPAQEEAPFLVRLVRRMRVRKARSAGE